MEHRNAALLITPGRVLLGLYFLVPGIFKFTSWDQHMALMDLHNVPLAPPLLVVAGVTNIIGGLMLIANRHVRLVSLGFAVYIVLVNYFLHDFWNFSALTAQHETQNFIKNLGILAGLLVLAGASPARPLRLEDLKRSDASIVSTKG